MQWLVQWGGTIEKSSCESWRPYVYLGKFTSLDFQVTDPTLAKSQRHCCKFIETAVLPLVALVCQHLLILYLATTGLRVETSTLSKLSIFSKRLKTSRITVHFSLPLKVSAIAFLGRDSCFWHWSRWIFQSTSILSLRLALLLIAGCHAYALISFCR